MFLGGCSDRQPPGGQRLARNDAQLVTGHTKCSAARGLMACGPRCVAISSDPHNCGACGVTCSPSMACVLGVCTRQSHTSVAAFHDPQTWTSLGPAYGGRLSAVVARDIGGSTDLVVASPGGGVWDASTGAPPWSKYTATSTWVADFSAVDLEIDKRDPTRLYMSTYSDLYARSESDSHWTNVTQGSAEPGLLPLGASLVDPRPFAQMLCPDGTTRVFQARSCSGLWYSLDSGGAGTFQIVVPFSGSPTNPDNCIDSIAADESTGRVWIATESRTSGDAPHVFASTDGCNWCTDGASCASWASANAGLPSAAGIVPTAVPLAWTGTADGLATVTYDASVPSMRAYTYHGASNKWKAGGVIAQEPAQRYLLWAGGQRLFWGGIEGYTSGDLGSSWNEFYVSGEHQDVRATFADATLGKVWNVSDGTSWDYASSVARFDYTGPSAGPTCESGSLPVCDTGSVGDAGQSTLQLYYITHVPGTSRFFVGTQDNGAACSDDANASFVPYAGGQDWIAMVVHPVATNVAYRIMYQGGLAKSTDVDPNSSAFCQGAHWSCPRTDGGSCAALYPGSAWSENTLAVDPRAGREGVVAVVKNYNVDVSTDGGQTWPTDTPVGNAVRSVAFDDSGYLYVGTYNTGIYRCTDTTNYCPNSTDWTPFGLNSSPPAYVLSVRKTHPAGADPTYWAATTSGLYRKATGVDSDWTLVTGGGGYTVNEVEAIPGYPNCVYAGLGFLNGMVQHRGGVQFSSDNGQTWTSITAGLDIHGSPISDIVPDDTDPHKLYVATFGLGAWSYNWNTLLPAACGGS